MLFGLLNNIPLSSWLIYNNIILCSKDRTILRIERFRLILYLSSSLTLVVILNKPRGMCFELVIVSIRILRIKVPILSPIRVPLRNYTLYQLYTGLLCIAWRTTMCLYRYKMFGDHKSKFFFKITFGPCKLTGHMTPQTI